jgi:hypothetical protein
MTRDGGVATVRNQSPESIRDVCLPFPELWFSWHGPLKLRCLCAYLLIIALHQCTKDT